MQNHLPKTKSEMNQWPRHVVSRPLIVVGAIALLLSLLGVVLLWYLNAPPGSQVVITNGADRWAKDNATTAGAIPFTAPETLQIPVDPAFTAYYQTHAGAKLLGAPVTPGFPIAEGWIQFFTANALLLPAAHRSTPTNASQAEQQIDSLIQDGLKDRRSGIIQLPLLHALLTIGSQVTVGGGLTYVDLRAATRPDQMRLAPAAHSAAPIDPLQSLLDQGTFIQTGTRAGRQIGHVIPAPIWAYITRRDVSPDGWQTDLGLPLTDAIPFANVQYGASHRLVIQAFWRGALIMDRDVKDASGQPLIYPLDTGVAYLKTLVPPTPVLGARTSIWATSDISILSAPNTGIPTVHVGPRFPLHLLGETQWSAGTLWYHVQWQGKTTSGTGWAPASGTTFSAPGSAAAWAAFDLLSSSLAQYLTSQSATTSAVVYDLTRQRYYAQPNSLSNRYLMGNAVKLPIVLAFLALTEQQGRRPSSDEKAMLSALMQSADAETGEELYDEIGRALGLKEYLQRIGVAGLVPENDDLLYSEAQPLAMVQLLSMLYQGKVLTSQDRALVFSLLENTPPDQRVGVGDTSPQGATVVMKDGWVMGTDGLWAMNSSGIVTVNGETYIISVSSAHLSTLADGQAIARQVCARVAALLP